MANSWKQLARNTVLDTKHLKVHVDKVELPGGKTIDDYSVVSFNHPVIIVATDRENNLITIKEYRYALDRVMLTLPAGCIDGDEDPLQTAKRELLEETGYESEEFEYIGKLYEYPTKADHATHIVRVKNAVASGRVAHEATEQIISVDLIPVPSLAKAIKEQQFQTAVVMSAIIIAMPQGLLKSS